MVDIAYMRGVSPIKKWCNRPYRPYTKSTISQKLKVVQKTHDIKKIFVRSMRIFSVNLATFKQLFFLVVVTVNCK